MDLSLLQKGQQYFVIVCDKNDQGLFDPKYVRMTYIDETVIQKGEHRGQKTYMFNVDGTIRSVPECMFWAIYDNEYQAQEITQSIINYLSNQSVSSTDTICPFGQCDHCGRPVYC